jgi:hypothetical protein
MPRAGETIEEWTHDDETETITSSHITTPSHTRKDDFLRLKFLIKESDNVFYKKRQRHADGSDMRKFYDERAAKNKINSTKNLFCPRGSGVDGQPDEGQGGPKVVGCGYYCRNKSTLEKHAEKCKWKKDEKEKLSEEFEVEKAKWKKSSGVDALEVIIHEAEAKKKALYSTPEGLKFSRGSGVRIVGGNEQTKKIGEWFEKKIASMGEATNEFLPEKCRGCPKLFGNADAVAKHSEKCKGGKKWCEEMARDTIENRKLWRRS